MTVWKRTMDYLGLGSDDAYDSYDDGVDERAPRAARNDAGRRPRGYADDGVGEARGPAPRPAYPSPDGRGRPGIVGDPTVNVHSPERLAPAHEPMSRPPSSGGGGSEPHAVRPRRFDEAQEVADKFKEGLPVIMNLESAERDVARRLIDFASGLCYGLDGTMEKVATGVYLLKPPAVRPRVDGYGYD